MAFWNYMRTFSLFVLLWVVILGGRDAVVAYSSLNASPLDLNSCLSGNGIQNVTFKSSSSSGNYYSLLEFSLQNLRYAEESLPKPYAIIVPENRDQLHKSVQCSIQNRWQIVVRSGGHSYEGLSSTSQAPNFVIIDVMKLEKVEVDMESKTAWVESGATFGQLYSAIANKTSLYGFPTGVCPTVGVGGAFSGGGLGLLSRKYGVAADHIINALLVDASGELVDRFGMGEDVFWALRGGGGGSWGVVVAWQIRLVQVPPIITAFNFNRTGSDNVTELVQRWQTVAPLAPEDLYIRVFVFGDSPIYLTFNGMYLGPLPQLLQLMNGIFPELGLGAADCNETDWIGSVIYTAVANGYSADFLNRYLPTKRYFKNKSDYVKSPIPASGLQGAWNIMEQKRDSIMILAPFGGVMNRIPSTQLPFPHRAGNLYEIQYIINWDEATDDAESVAWMRMLYEYMTPYVSNSPRAAYVNYVDLDLGHASANGTSTVEQAQSWGEKYFGGNFLRLVQIKTKFDPNNVFKNAQSIPPLSQI
ncbi:berberine bridge enzyme-like D-1 [Cryptomeria japonica]|uniref:berberine bridge enzyme-like D-1 n=1 Tax=Cryptomeria japonica TaxID=3369 RepID=UPI0027DAB01B|nr:berberine bridge enzyme-like D-1 [Cryptomeria japonica]